ncbi:MAG: hypothetical protein A2268_13810 [Candidatus Raymondbacteria bacterium RifOxyA12_full_50_37]|uniref:BON domain-containing protein n=1 Tax=Candidatus Raymondbacteria bacterium RIFOXYD12_FULL_49_13 TaxID=1817890 RepID=A0A1F7F4X8_UNCRA|nr:MAG: hypothetical protein A2248_00740 [Candidatus Raymondbacteria bacterium RIFOXYA2_FULL_49_16]OGJ91931.1 MAG: hypothetical protein A2268_13810 [Candidatus Raymondbacteria bacterium RifOxyA12_full_50_37]OGJ95477.1 MAG: hypothetical protein A2453_05245 [Candidatus Raymondbacteria bacterium RIFOXYC2_FULL_50_21]OGJ95507.1 MAG: hypothetical protein A2350_01055 [Candidatus Raymondbacteria bacterium RifOxyB12_full_50_8]OGK01633.1 MAG: hypothetical protein A2519_07250 [Candidatus Raymondbacteria b
MKKLNLATKVLSAVIILGAAGVLFAIQIGGRIESSAKKSYVFKTYLKGDDIKIKTTNDSIVILTGTVSEWSHRSLAEETVAGLPGVVRVDNKLEVKGGQPAENSDIWIGMKVKTMLMFHRNVSGVKTEIDVKDGVVTLRGHAPSEAQRELTSEYVKEVEGVKSVNNDMKSSEPTKTNFEKVGDDIDDASITAQVKIALLFHKSTSAVNIKVSTNKGMVRIYGNVESSAEESLVVALVNNIKGVNGIINEMNVE